MRTTGIVTLLAVAGLACAAAAQAGPAAPAVDRNPPVLTVVGTASEENFGIRPLKQKFQVSERGGPPLAASGAGCEVVGSRVLCASRRIERLRVALGPGADAYHSKIGRLAKEAYPVVRGGPGSDTLSLLDHTPPTRIQLRVAILKGGSGSDFVEGGPGDDRLYGGTGEDHMLSSDAPTGDDFLSGGDGDDRLAGGPGDDVIRGGSGTDVCIPKRGNDRLYGCERVRN
jgi:RTX calcium-binding nonapeptide repeat (4 copies)